MKNPEDERRIFQIRAGINRLLKIGPELPLLLTICLTAAILVVTHNPRTEIPVSVDMPPATISEPAAETPPAEIPRHVEYGIPCDNFRVDRGKVEANQTLSKILAGRGVSQAIIHNAALAATGIFDVRKIRTGRPYCIIGAESEPAPEVLYFIYEINPVDYVVFHLKEPVEVYRKQKPVDVRTRTASGVIRSSLWETFHEQELDIDLAGKLADLYAWTIDFHHLQKGDRFKIIFEEKYSGGVLSGLGNIQCAQFTRGEEDFFAFHFQQDGVSGYFDEQGNSLQKTFLKAPVNYARISSRFSKRRFHPVLKRYKAHNGVDYAAAHGTPVVSVGDGVVLKASYDKYNGRFVKIRHNGIYATQYLHLSRFGNGIKKGKPVYQGQVIGYVGSTGLATGPHL